MNKQELIKHFEELPYVSITQMGKKSFIDLIEQLDEPEKVKVSQFVADWYEENKDDFEGNLFRCIYELFKKRNDSELNEFENWVIDANTKPFQTLVNMNQFGYEVEKEKRYLVKIKATKHYFAKDGNGRIYFSLKYESVFTKAELEKVGFGWVFDCEGVEVEEVEE